MSERPSIPEAEVTALGETLKYFKLNIPASFEDYQSGNGEGIWAVVKTAELKKQVDDDSIEIFTAYAANSSFAYPDIQYGSAIKAEIRNDCRPVAVWEDLVNSKEALVRSVKVKDKLMNRN